MTNCRIINKLLIFHIIQYVYASISYNKPPPPPPERRPSSLSNRRYGSSAGETIYTKPEGQPVDPKAIEKLLQSKLKKATDKIFDNYITRSSNVDLTRMQMDVSYIQPEEEEENEKKWGNVRTVKEAKARFEKGGFEDNNKDEFYMKLKSQARCGDMFSLMKGNNGIYPDGKSWTERIPVYNVGLVFIDLKFDTDSGIEYESVTKSKCDGTDGADGDICEVTCPNIANGLPVGQDDTDGDGKTNQFKCTCSINPDNPENEYVCYWRPLEKVWKQVYTCDRNRQMPPRARSRFRLITWWNASKTAQQRWNTTTSVYKKFLSDDYVEPEPQTLYNERPSVYSHFYREGDSDDEFLNVLDTWPDNDDLDEQLEEDDEYQLLLNKLIEFETMKNMNSNQLYNFQRQLKMVHLARLLHIYQLKGDKGYSNFVKYGCYCLNGNDDLHRGVGSPMDKIDTACKEHDVCVKCARLDNDDKCHPYRGYQFSIKRDDKGHLQHECLDNPMQTSGNANNCRFTLCECDKRLVERLLDFKDTYDTRFNKNNFEKVDHCISNCNINPVTNSCYKHDSCCNDSSGRRQPISSEGGRTRCCNNNVYDHTNTQCCEDGTIKPQC